MPPNLARTLSFLLFLFTGFSAAQKDGRSSLTFVFDSTGSMSDDLSAVKLGIRRIAVSSSKLEQIKNYILIKVHDPDVAEPEITEKIPEFYNKLSRIFVQGGGDCPEMTVTGIQKALLSSLPHSSIYVFTDGSAKDYNLTDNVLNLIQKTQSKVTFVMTGDCNNRSSPEFQAFVKIATVSTGQIFHISKKQVNEFLKIIELVIQTRKVNILVQDAETNGSAIYNAPVDNTIERLVVSVVSTDTDTPIKVNIRDKNGRLLKKGEPDGVDEQLQGSVNTYFGQVKKPTPGAWSIEVLSSGKHTIRITGQSPLDFLHGFHPKKVGNILNSAKRPLKGVLSYIYINMTDPLPSGAVSRVDLLTINGTTLGTLELKQSKKDPDLYISTTPIMPPAEQFFIKVIGKDNQGEKFQRFTPTGISSRDPEPPMVTCLQKQKALRGKTYKIKCEVKSDITYSVQWYLNGKMIGTPQYAIKKPGEVFYTISNADEDAEGVYRCNATNTAGSSVDHVTFKVLPPPPNIMAMKEVQSEPGQRVEVVCTVYSQNPERTNVRWYQNNKGLRLESSRRKQIVTRRKAEAIVSKLIIPDASLGDKATYLCEAGHEGGNTTKSISLIIQVPPQIVLDQQRVTYRRGGRFELYCRAEGYPLPTVSWEFRGSPMLPSNRVVVQDGRLEIRDPQFSDMGDYVCVAKSAAGESRANVTAVYIEPPVVEVQEKEVQAVISQPLSIKCIARGVPKPQIRWERNGQTIPRDSPQYSYDEMGTLTIKKVTLDMDGQWTCVAVNEAGPQADVVEINVGTPPSISKMESPISVVYGQNVTLFCNAKGSPKPKIEWLRGRRPGFRPLPFESKYSLRRDNSLVIQNVKLSDKGFYTCMARNSINADSQSVQIVVTGMQKPRLPYRKDQVTAVEGDRKRIKCTVTESKPEPTLVWIRNDKEMKSDGRIIVNRGNLIFNAVKAEDAGPYVCVAKNEVGTAQWKVRLIVETRPRIIGKRREDINVIQGKSIVLECKAKGDPEPMITWTKDGGPISFADTAYNLLQDDSLEIFSVTQAHQGLYVCTAKNRNSMDTKEIKVSVQTPPRIRRTGSDTMIAKIGNTVLMPCTLEAGFPKPTLKWYRGSQEVRQVVNRILITPSNTLEIRDVQKEDASSYECRATNVAGIDSRMFNLDIILPPVPGNDTKRERLVVTGQDVTIRCQVNGYPRPNITWYFKEKRLTQYDMKVLGVVMNYKDQSLFIRNAGKHHRGEYKCVATNRGGTTEITVNVIVTQPPIIDKTLPNVTAALIDTGMVLNCVASGNPKPNITWYFNNQKIPSQGPEMRYNAQGSLVIRKARPYHGGLYRCVATNKAGKDERSITAIVFNDQAANVTGGPPPIPPKEGGNITFKCEIKSTPPPEIHWYKNNIPIWKVMAQSRYRVSADNKSLTLYNIKSEDRGQYSCVAENIPGNLGQKFILTVDVSPLILTYKSSRARITVREGEAIELKCLAKGSPTPEVRWYKDGRLILATDEAMALTDDLSTLTIDNAKAKDAGAYVCEAYNKVGKDTRKMIVMVEVPPVIKDSEKLERPRLIVGEEAKLKCEVEKGSPVPDIVWVIDQSVVFSGGNYQMSKLNQELLIKKVDMSHATRISCKAINSVGTARKFFDPVILSAPVISKTSDIEQVVVEKRRIILSCYIERGNPRPNITWYRNGEVLKDGLFANIQLRSQGTQLHLNNAKRTDAAKYKCVASNDAGKDELTYTLEVQVPAYIELHTPDKTPEVVLTRSLVLFCIAKGRPEPSIKWLKDNQPITSGGRILLRNGDKELIINKTVQSDGGRYTCRASNTIAMDSRNFDVSITYAPRLEIGGRRQYTWKAQTGSSVMLECPVTGYPKPKLEWRKNGELLPQSGRFRYRNDKRQVEILMINIDDQAKYTCVAENSIGSLEITNVVDVGKRPTIESAQLQMEYKIAEGETLVIACPATGTPRPKIVFQSGGEKLGMTPGYIVSQIEQTLRILSIKKTDSGIYRCIAENTAGRVAIDFKVTVLIPPRIDDSNLVGNVDWVVGQSRSLECPLMGKADPPASITWERDGSPLLDGPGIRVSPDRRQVHVQSVTLADAGSYACVATNDVASIKQEYTITVKMRPIFDESVTKFEHTVIQNSSVLLDCSARGVPDPAYHWSRGGRFLVNNNLDVKRLRIINDGRRFELLNAQSYDSMNYSCLVGNDVGNVKRDFVLKVIVPPEIERSRQSPILVSVQENQPIRLNCTVVGGMTSDIRITWYKGESPILVSESSEIYRVVDSGQGLIITAPLSTDSGLYKCTASNKAGFENLAYKVDVVVPPTFPKDFQRSRERISARVNDPVTLTCPASGYPEPIITWFKANRVSDPSTQYVRIQQNGRIFELVSPLAKDKGLYHCIAENKGGRIRKEYVLSVMEPVKVRIPYEVKDVQEERDIFKIRCDVSGDPKPDIRWFKDGIRLRPSSRISYEDEGTYLVIRAVRADDAGTYRCEAENKLNRASQSVIVNVLRPPQLFVSKKFVTAILGERAILPCRADGIPKPAITWDHDLFTIQRSVPGFTLTDTSLMLHSVESRHSGRWRCNGKSSIGSTTEDVRLKVVEPPRILSTSPRIVTQLSDSNVQLKCSFPRDHDFKVWWEFNNQRITSEDLRYRTFFGDLNIPRLTEDDNGKFSCVAQNEAGRDVRTFQVTVLVRPEARIPRQMYTYNVGETAQINCEVRGTPRPSIIWKRRGSIIKDPRYTVLQERILRITGVRQTDEGTLRCVAQNEAGVSNANTMLRVRTRPKFTNTPPKQIEVNENGFRDLECNADGRPPPKIQFFHNGTILSHNPSSGGWGRYTIKDARPSSAGLYECVARNPAGRVTFRMRVRVVGRPRVFVIQSDQAVKESSEAILSCDVKGENYKIVWLKDDEEIKDNKRFVKSKNGTLIIKDAKSADAGTYRCLAINGAGQDEGKVILTIQSIPKFSLQPQNSTTIRGQTVLIPCLAEAYPRPKVRWYKDSRNLKMHNRHTVFSNGSLMIVGASTSDSGVYQCVAENKYGEVHSRKAKLSVVVHGKWGRWTAWSACSSTCGSGKKMRTRKCDSPAPQHGGRRCQGRSEESIFCLIKYCPVDGGWGNWTDWDECSVTCGDGVQSRSRRCDNPPSENGGRTCEGDNMENRQCRSDPCPIDGLWGPWMPWGRCSVSCGLGKATRRRQCDSPPPRDGGRPCRGSKEQTRPCGQTDCPVNGGWSDWFPWTECSQSCGGGYRRRERRCDRPPPSGSGRYCDGQRSQIESCNKDVFCPIDGDWTMWSTWSRCSHSCGTDGRMVRTRTCTDPAPRFGGQPCLGDRREMRVCNRQSCPTAVFTQWSRWSECSVPCGGGITQRSRECLGPEECKGETRQQRTCNNRQCPTKAPEKPISSALGRITGFINNYPIGVVLVNGEWTRNADRKRTDFRVRLDHVPDTLSGCFQSLTGALSPLLWIGAYEVNRASNGFTVTGGNFKRNSEVFFASGAVLKMTHHVTTNAGQLSFTTVVRGACPDHIQGRVSLTKYVEKYVQTKPEAIYSHSSNGYKVDKQNHPYAWNHTITYSSGRQQRYITQKMVVEDIFVSYERPIRRINFKLSSIIAGDGDTCPKGFELVDKKYCRDMDECRSGTHKCEQKCLNMPGTYICSCGAGYKLAADGRSCKDDNECRRGTHTCNRRNQRCINTVGSYRCILKCGVGLRGVPNGQCIDIDECTEKEGICGGRICKNTYGSYRCTCKLGFRSVGSNCEDVDECREGLHKCPKGEVCINTPGSYKCIRKCPIGFRFVYDGSCVDVDECETNLHRCEGISRCVNTVGSYRCDCPAGYRKINGVCKDIDECSLDPQPCAYRCKNTDGDYECICPRGSSRLPDKKTCDGVGGKKCRRGYEFIFDRGCVDIDECRKNTTCQYRCINEPGSHRCVCPRGYEVTAKGKCKDINECKINRLICGGEKLCMNTRGSHHCVSVTCPRGYTFDPFKKVCNILCSKSNLTCPVNSRYAESVIFSVISFPAGRRYSSATIRVRDGRGSILRYCKFHLLDHTQKMPFAFKEKRGYGIIHTTSPTKTTKDLYFMRLRASCYETQYRQKLVYQNSFFVYISVSKYPF